MFPEFCAPKIMGVNSFFYSGIVPLFSRYVHCERCKAPPGFSWSTASCYLVGGIRSQIVDRLLASARCREACSAG